jgi:putative transposase
MDIHRSRVYYKPAPDDSRDVVMMNEMRDIYTKCPFYGYRRMHVALQAKGYECNHKKTQRLMKCAGLIAVYPRKKTTIRNLLHKTYPYLLRGLDIVRSNQVWATDITYIKLRNGFGYLVCIIDIFSRKILGWAFGPFLDTQLCIDAFEEAIKHGTSEILNTDQGCQFTSNQWTETMIKYGIAISMDGKGRWADNIYIERFWRSIKYEAVYLHSFDTMAQARQAIGNYIEFYNNERPHQSLQYKTPHAVYTGCIDVPAAHLKNGAAIDHLIEGGELSQIQPLFLS